MKIWLLKIFQEFSERIYQQVKGIWFTIDMLTQRIIPKGNFLPHSRYLGLKEHTNREGEPVSRKLSSHLQPCSFPRSHPQNYPSSAQPLAEDPDEIFLGNLDNTFHDKTNSQIASTYSRWDCMECKDFRNVGDLFHPLGPAKASFSVVVCMTIPCAFLHDYKFDQVL